MNLRGSSTGCIRVVAAILLAITWNLSWRTVGVGAPVIIRLTAKEWQYEPKEVSSSAGDVMFEVRNGGLIEHNFVVEDQTKQKRAEIPYIEPGETLKTTANLEAGTYTIYCSLPGHRDAGMVATLHLR